MVMSRDGQVFLSARRACAHGGAGWAGSVGGAGVAAETFTRLMRSQPVGSSAEIDPMAKPGIFTLSRFASMGCDRSRAAKALKTSAPLNLLRRVARDSSPFIASTSDVGDGVKSS